MVGGWVAYCILVSAPVPLGFRSYWDLVGVGTRGFGTKGLGTGLDNKSSYFRVKLKRIKFEM